ncbi:pyridoxamine 5'-phosphate oxidase family protein [Acidisoma cellulosilytica]|uniref:Pyridoxamine 5'-phosphate oxidase family protein n=1 Tax=Acidisoma cellulosilyticum TaxID=2802395 RepID=A0A964E2D7_9PROT|nr:pyridoxamine 5'-phosphate oxidase family protein [Acidisoma cellulosilyticum]MCB8879194.1 pyridoxamine 5'-phosphate oxidase family protein [Acidisoma cellulosilyticum]
MIETIEALEAIYGPANPRSLQKEIPQLNADYRAFVEAAPMIILATVGPEGLDCSPKGDAPGFVRILDDSTLAIPDRPGNNRIDNLRNIIRDPRISLLFIIPGVGETLRVNGVAVISDDADLLAQFAVGGKPPKTVILVTIESVYFHCAKAFVRSALWDPARHVERSKLPSAGQILQHISQGVFDGAGYDRDLPERTRATLY